MYNITGVAKRLQKIHCAVSKSGFDSLVKLQQRLKKSIYKPFALRLGLEVI